jgi:hypothetical protein
VSLDDNETDDPRVWTLDLGVARALCAFTAATWHPTPRASAIG